MKKKLFIIGGAGNVYIQKLYLKSKGHDYTISKLLVSKRMRKFLGHTNHALSADELLELNIKENFFINALFLIDLIIGKIFKKTFVTEVDLNTYKSKPLFFTLFYVGYFQKSAEINFTKNNHLIKKSKINEDIFDLCIHFRGGDFIRYGSQISNDYYKNSIDMFSRMIDCNFLNIVIVTDDKIYAKKELEKLQIDFEYEIKSGNALHDLNVMMSSKHLITSNSTFSLIAALERDNKGITILPKEFFETFSIVANKYVFKV